MTVSVAAVLTSQLNVTETFSGVGYPTPQSILQNGLNETVSLSGTSSPAVSVCSIGAVSLVAGSATLSLQSLQGVEGDTVSLAGLKVQFAKLTNPATNTHNITVAPGGANPYNLFGASFSFTLAPGQSVLFNANAATPTVGAGAQNLAISGTGTDTLDYQFVGG